MGMWIGRNRKARVTYGFDEIALVPGRVTVNPNEVDITFRLPRKAAEPLELKIPILASAMDGVVDVGFAIAMNKLGGLAVLNWKEFKHATRTRRKSCKKLSKRVNRKLLRCSSEFTRNLSNKILLRRVCARSRMPAL
jgi:IMP dehydrogenase/GMP reductase